MNIFEFDPQIYPRRLWVSVGASAEELPEKFGKILTNILIVLLAIDFAVSWGALIRQQLRYNGVPPFTVVGEFFDKYYPDEVLKESYANMVVIEVRD